MMPKARYNYVISLNEEDQKKLTELRKAKWQIIEIFRIGMDKLSSMQKKVKDLVK